MLRVRFNTGLESTLTTTPTEEDEETISLMSNLVTRKGKNLTKGEIQWFSMTSTFPIFYLVFSICTIIYPLMTYYSNIDIRLSELISLREIPMI